MTHTYDVAVIGGGVAGTAAALAAARSGARTCVIRSTSLGASAMTSGGWLGELPVELRTIFTAAGLDLHRVTAELPHPSGDILSFDYAPAAHANAVLQPAALVCGIAGLPGFHAEALARLWGARAAVPLEWATLQLPRTPAAGWAPVSLATMLEHDAATLLDRLLDVLAEKRPTSVVLPAVLGLTHTSTTRTTIELAAGVPVGEALGIPPSLPGWRLQQTLQRALVMAKVTVIEARATAEPVRAARVDEVRLGHDASSSVRANAFVLATGKFVAGGIQTDERLRETVFDCPVWVEHLGQHFVTAEALTLTDPARDEHQPLLEAGVHVDREQRPVNRSGDVVYSNVFVAGSLRAGWAAGARGLAESASDGWLAGERAARA